MASGKLCIFLSCECVPLPKKGAVGVYEAVHVEHVAVWRRESLQAAHDADDGLRSLREPVKGCLDVISEFL